MPTPFVLRPLRRAIALTALLPLSAFASDDVTPEQVVTHYADLAHATFQDALTAARTLDARIDDLLAAPGDETLAAARQAWIQARVPYQQSEAFRFGNPVVDDWEGQLNAWPLDEGLIDYVAADDYQHELGNAGATANLVANTSIQIGGETLDVSELTPELLADLNEIGGSEANVATGYHAIEFLLWGQDRHGFEAGNGERPASDYLSGDDCTHGHCDRRGAYLDAVSDLLVSDLEWMVAQWAPNEDDNYRQALLAEPASEGLRRMLFGMGSLSLGELAGERMKVALAANSVEDEHDCFSDNTHNSHYYDAQGVQNVYSGEYRRLDGSTLSGPSLSALLAAEDPELDATLSSQLEATMAELGELKRAAEDKASPMTFDMMIAPGNEDGAALINDAILALVTQTGSIEKAAGTLGVTQLQPDDAGHDF
ncbi:imelysin family protein [Halomonas organivorans]|uniref:Putative iron-regulated protein n=1 Tax=Halomonas organivorans TaxID=257772 RepID=A0A7W5G4R0_9GAMM|nr:imelysin family protein [Halomonas organivorans]MBB3140658.1 putative iron-regulated protein [Halomonas organivorans]